MAGEHEVEPSATDSKAVRPDSDDPGRAMQARAAREAAQSRAFLAESVATKAPTAPAGIAGLGLATVLLFLNDTILSLGNTAAGNDVALRDGGLAVVLGLTTLCWYGLPMSRVAPAVACLVALLLVVISAGWLDAPTGARVMDGVYAVLILGSTGLRLASLRPSQPA